MGRQRQRSFKLFLLLTSFLEGGHAVLETGLEDTEQGHFRGGPSRWEPRKGRRACVWRLPILDCCPSLCPEPPRPPGGKKTRLFLSGVVVPHVIVGCLPVSPPD